MKYKEIIVAQSFFEGPTRRLVGSSALGSFQSEKYHVLYCSVL